MEGGAYDPLLWTARGRELVRAAKAGKVPGIRLDADVGGWPATWVSCSQVFLVARAVAGSTAASLASTLARVRSWKGVAALRVPKNFVDDLKIEVAIEPIAAIEPARFGVAVDWL